MFVLFLVSNLPWCWEIISTTRRKWYCAITLAFCHEKKSLRQQHFIEDDRIIRIFPDGRKEYEKQTKINVLIQSIMLNCFLLIFYHFRNNVGVRNGGKRVSSPPRRINTSLSLDIMSIWLKCHISTLVPMKLIKEFVIELQQFAPELHTGPMTRKE